MTRINKEEYPSNSMSRGTPQKKKQITKGRVVQRKESILGRIFGDNARSVGSYVLWDVIIPAAKSTISDIISNGIEMLLYGEPDRRHIRRNRGRSYVRYNSIYDERRPRTRTAKQRARSKFDDIVIDTHGEADEVLSQLVECIENYDVATVADFYDLVGINSDWSDHKYGWYNLAPSKVERVRDGYVIVLPRPEVLD